MLVRSVLKSSSSLSIVAEVSGSRTRHPLISSLPRIFGVCRRRVQFFAPFVEIRRVQIQNDGQRARLQHPRRPQEEDEGHEGGMREVPGRLRGLAPKVASRDRQERGSKRKRLLAGIRTRLLARVKERSQSLPWNNQAPPLFQRFSTAVQKQARLSPK